MAVGWTSKVVASAQTALWREGSGIDFWMPKNIHSLLLAQLSIRLFHPHCFHLSAPFISSYIYLIIFSSLFFFDSLSVSLPSRPFSGFPLRLMFFLPLNGLTRDRRRDSPVDEEASHSESSAPFGFIYFQGQIRGVVFLGARIGGHL